MTEWTCNSNEALTISLLRAPEEANDQRESFHPTFTYPIYGEDETVYGYKDLAINVQMASGSLATRVSSAYSAKLKSSSSTVDDVEGILAKFLPDDHYKAADEAAFLQRVKDDASSFRPFGQKIYSYTTTGKGKGRALEDDVEYEVYHATFDVPGFKEYHRRMQLFILLYIEAGSYINEEEDGWEFVVLYEKRKSRSQPGSFTYHFAGYSSLYQFYYYPDRLRLRLSQFVILPPYQRHGHGSELYKSIYEYVLRSPHFAELTVEDPAEAFEDLRDRSDLRMLLAHQKFMEEGFGADALTAGTSASLGKRKRVAGAFQGKMGPPADKAWLEKWRLELKIAGRQFHRLVEMLQLLHLEATGADASAVRAYRLQVKERLYRFNYEILMQLEREERLEKLEETFQSVKDDYLRLLAGVQ
ncbi:histone acetyltransferase type B catalytic subunit [Punctularia strigosozonata HHB-11173 SS5]|uniref:histone acetyltransferase type B catalytic subunit n=1 Tax=Punctularia strigosozonata (strain HHB-11173) TaxID=741275 RepID=UPI0004416F6D|nr:histone acetyltransferase type B catalytic subunit [Punctularia strigosozonata HHB-11173 SS5]EIN08019.1 histone acetyltransferase type B catalytic subunit [Punctularia strigosozonata HHB-11173 SS5]